MSDSLAAASPLSGVAARAGVAVRYLAIAIGFTLPISTALDNVLLALLLTCWAASGHWRAKYEMIRNKTGLGQEQMILQHQSGQLVGPTNDLDLASATRA